MRLVKILIKKGIGIYLVELTQVDPSFLAWVLGVVCYDGLGKYVYFFKKGYKR
jgi:hypothetical protein